MTDIKDIYHMILQLDNGFELRMVRMPAGDVVVRGSDNGNPIKCFLSQEFWLSESPITVRDWHEVMREECGQYDDGPGFATGMPWVEAREFCRVLHNKNIHKLPDGYVVNLPTQAQWERSLDLMCPNAEIVGCGERHVALDQSSLKLYQSVIDGDPFTLVLGLDEMCLDAPLDDSCMSSVDCIGPLRPDARASRAIGLCSNPHSVRMYRGYGMTGYGEIKWGGPRTGFRVAIHTQATGLASAPSPQILGCTWGRTIVDGIGEHKDVKLYPGGGREWHWSETNTHHVPGVGIHDAIELFEWGSRHIIIGCGFHEKLKITAEVAQWSADFGITLEAMNSASAVKAYNSLAAGGKPVGALIHSTC